MKYYTIDQAVKRSYQTQEIFTKADVTEFYRGIKNLARIYVGLKPKVYYFERDYNGTARTRQSGMETKGTP